MIKDRLRKIEKALRDAERRLTATREALERKTAVLDYLRDRFAWSQAQGVSVQSLLVPLSIRLRHCYPSRAIKATVRGMVKAGELRAYGMAQARRYYLP